MKRIRFTLTFTAVSSLVFLLLLTWVLVGFIVVRGSQKELYRQKTETCRLLLSVINETLATNPDPRLLARVAQSLSSTRDLESLMLVDASGRAVLSIPNSAVPDERLRQTVASRAESSLFSAGAGILYYYAPVRGGDGSIAASRIGLSLRREHERLEDFSSLFTAYFILDSILLLLIGAFLLSRFVVKPIRRLASATGRVAAGDLTHHVPEGGAVEIVELAGSFNAMTEALRQKRTEAERHVQSLEEANRVLEIAREETRRSERLASVGLLAAGTAHEVGTPLAAIIGYCDILLQDLQDQPEKLECVARAAEEARRIDRIIRGLLDYARPVQPHIEEVSPADFLREAHDMMQAQGLFKRLRAEFRAAEDLPPLSVDRSQLMQVLLNLVLNARDAMGDDGTLRVSADVGEAGAGKPAAVTISVSDSGGGIPPENLEKIFDPFFTTKEPGKGTGLGLSISARIVDSFGGDIRVASTPGNGSCFTVTLPAGGER